MRWRFWILMTLVIAVAAVGSLYGFIRLGKRTYELLPPQRRGAPVSLRWIDAAGSITGFERLRGKVLAVDVWASWCGPCITSLPQLNALRQELEPRGFEVVGLSVDEDGWETLRPFLAQRPWLQYRVGTPLDSARLHDTLSYLPGLGAVAALPTTFLLDQHGRVAYKHVGMLTASDLRPSILQLLGETD